MEAEQADANDDGDIEDARPLLKASPFSHDLSYVSMEKGEKSSAFHLFTSFNVTIGKACMRGKAFCQTMSLSVPFLPV